MHTRVCALVVAGGRVTAAVPLSRVWRAKHHGGVPLPRMASFRMAMRMNRPLRACRKYAARGSVSTSSAICAHRPAHPWHTTF